MKSPADAGFSLIEVLVAMAIFAIASLATTSLMVGSTAMISENNAASQAISLAQTAMEDIRNTPFDQMESGAAYQDIGGRQFEIVWQVTEDSPDDDMNTVNVNVAWEEKGTTRQYEINNILAKVSNVDNN